MTVDVVTDPLWGDGGKGSTTAFIISQHANSGKPRIVIRHCGGHQSGHTFCDGDTRIVFRQLTATAILGGETHLSEHFIVEPKAFIGEYQRLPSNADKNFSIHPNAIVCTPLDVKANKESDENIRHGTCGMGIGKTVTRSENPEYRITVGELNNSSRETLRRKLYKIGEEYYKFDMSDPSLQFELMDFADFAVAIGNYAVIKEPKLDEYEHIIFEGSQGMMLDRNSQFFPHVTHAKTTSHNALEILKANNITTRPEMWYPMRAYATKHGAGDFPGEEEALFFKDPTNITNPHQGKLRFGWHSADVLRNAMKLESDKYREMYKVHPTVNYIISHLDQTNDIILCDFSKYSSGDIWDFIEQFNVARIGKVLLRRSENFRLTKQI